MIPSAQLASAPALQGFLAPSSMNPEASEGSRVPSSSESLPHLAELCSDLGCVAGSPAARSGPAFSNSCFLARSPDFLRTWARLLASQNSHNAESWLQGGETGSGTLLAPSVQGFLAVTVPGRLGFLNFHQEITIFRSERFGNLIKIELNLVRLHLSFCLFRFLF